MANNIIKCALCTWQTIAWSAHSKPSKAWSRLISHIEESHPEEYDKLDVAAAMGHPEFNPDGKTVGEIFREYLEDHVDKK